jgi:hypothetical protein
MSEVQVFLTISKNYYYLAEYICLAKKSRLTILTQRWSQSTMQAADDARLKDAVFICEFQRLPADIFD